MSAKTGAGTRAPALPGCIAANPMLTARRPDRGADSGLPFRIGQPVVYEEANRVETSSGHLGGSIQASLGGRYATALFELARDEKALPAVEASLVAVRGAIDQSDEFQRLIASPLLGRDAAAKAVAAVAAAMKLDAITTRFLGVLAQNRRLSQLPQIIRAFRQLAAAQRGETTAEVTSAHPLDAGQVAELKAQLKTRLRRDVTVDLSVDPSLLGGLVVKIGSQMIDSSIRTRLNTLAHAMKG
jgi:F-type H+-transporting ATPase subunit delta